MGDGAQKSPVEKGLCSFIELPLFDILGDASN